MLSPFPLLLGPGVISWLLCVLVWLQCPTQRSCSSDPISTRPLPVGKPARKLQSVETSDGLMKHGRLSSDHMHLYRHLRTEASCTDRATWIVSRQLVLRRAARSPRPQDRTDPLLSTQRWIEESQLRDFSKKLFQSQRMGTSPSWSCSAAQATV